MTDMTVSAYFNRRSASRLLVAAALCFVSAQTASIGAAESEFRATGPRMPVKLPPREKGAVQVTFDLVPTSMSFDLPSFPCMVTENGIKYSNFWAETYELSAIGCSAMCAKGTGSCNQDFLVLSCSPRS